METITSRQALLAWLFLVIASVFTAGLGDGGGEFGHWGVIAILMIALLKARAVILYYMAVRCAPWPLRLAFEAWVVLVTVMIGGLWLAQEATLF